MKLILFITLFFLHIGNNGQKQSHAVFNVMTFTDVPKNMEGCGENLFLNKHDEKAAKFIFYTDYDRALICIDNKMILIKGNESNNKTSSSFSNNDYQVVIKYLKEKTTGDEDYDIKSATMIIKYHSKIIWSKNVIGGGGC
jgi:hypothetical protein